MKEERILDVLGKVDEKYIEEADPEVKAKRKTPAWIKWAAMAACLCIVAVVALTQMPFDVINNPSHQTTPNQPDSLLVGQSTSDTYKNLPDLLSYLSKHDSHNEYAEDASGRGNGASVIKGNNENAEVSALVENTGVAISATEKYSYHIGECAVFISLLDGENSKNVGNIPTNANAVFIVNNNLLVISEYQSGGNELDVEMSVRVAIYDISNPEAPILQDEYSQLGELTACWMVNSDLYLATSDGVCACGWSRLEDTADYYPSLTHNGEDVPWTDSSISILGEPTNVQYTAITVFNGNTCEIVKQNALYGSIHYISYGVDWLTAVVAGNTASMRENPVVYTFDGNLNFTGKISTAQILDVPHINKAKEFVPQDGVYLDIMSVNKVGDVYQMIGVYSEREDETNRYSFMALTADIVTGETDAELIVAEQYPYIGYTEILWEENRAIACVAKMQNAFSNDMYQETTFVFCEFDGTNIAIYENDLTADYLSGRVGTSYGSPFGNFETLISMDNGIYVRYTALQEGPGGFDVYDFTDSAHPKLLYRCDKSISGEDAFDYVWHVYDNQTFGTLKVLLGQEDCFRNVDLAWCVFDVNSATGAITQLSETSLDIPIKTFFGSDSIGFEMFSAGDTQYFVTKELASPRPIK